MLRRPLHERLREASDEDLQAAYVLALRHASEVATSLSSAVAEATRDAFRIGGEIARRRRP